MNFNSERPVGGQFDQLLLTSTLIDKTLATEPKLQHLLSRNNWKKSPTLVEIQWTMKCS